MEYTGGGLGGVCVCGINGTLSGGNVPLDAPQRAVVGHHGPQALPLRCLLAILVMAVVGTGVLVLLRVLALVLAIRTKLLGMLTDEGGERLHGGQRPTTAAATAIAIETAHRGVRTLVGGRTVHKEAHLTPLIWMRRMRRRQYKSIPL